MSGWIKLQRDIVDHWIAQDCEYLAVWIRMLTEANFETRKKLFNGQLITVERGQLIFGLDSYAATTKVSVMRLRRLIELLEKDGMIIRVKNSKYSIITILNYTKYQDGNRPVTPTEQAENIQIADIAQAQNSTIRNTELKNKNMSENSDEFMHPASQSSPNKQFEQKLLSNLFEDFWKKYPVKHGKQEAKKAWNRFMRGKSENEIRKCSSLMLSYQAYRSEKNIIENKGFNPLQNKMAQGFINSRCWEDEPGWIEQFNQEWLEYHQPKQTGELNGTTN